MYILACSSCITVLSSLLCYVTWWVNRWSMYKPGMEEGRMESCPRKQEMGWTIKHTVYMYMTCKVSHWTSYFMGDKATVVAFTLQQVGWSNGGSHLKSMSLYVRTKYRMSCGCVTRYTAYVCTHTLVHQRRRIVQTHS